ncbi:MAG: 50S ribosomal protein L10 [Candidatus Marinimicrobia bacterium]|nr:50S ribosomal protein L10 [Candidatus Neomarinimicrobiota bacterium]
MKSKEQKNLELKSGEELFKKSQSLIFVDFGKVSNENTRLFKAKLKKIDAQFKVVKKRLLGIILKENKIDFDPHSVFEGQMGTIFSGSDINSAAGPVYKSFAGIQALGAYDLKEKQFLAADVFKKIALLPSREVLLSQVVGMVAAPIKMFMYLISEKSKQTVEKQ